MRSTARRGWITHFHPLVFQKRQKKPSTSELLDWIKLLLVEDISPEVLRTRDPAKQIPPLHGALLKNEEDVHLFERLAFLHRRERSSS